MGRDEIRDLIGQAAGRLDAIIFAIRAHDTANEHDLSCAVMQTCLALAALHLAVSSIEERSHVETHSVH